MSEKDFETSPVGDFTEKEPHLTPTGEVIAQGKTVEVPAERWVDVPKGYVAAPGTYLDDAGVLRSVGDDSCVVWHIPSCKKRGIQPDEIIYDVNRAPWCPECYEKNEQTREKKKIEEIFRGKAEKN